MSDTRRKQKYSSIRLKEKEKKCNFYLLMKDKNTLMKLTRDFGNNNNF